MTAARGRKKVRREFFVGRQKTPEVCCCSQQVSSGHALIKKHKAAALRCLWRIIVKEASGKSFDTPLTGGRWAYWHLGICRTGGRMAHGGGRRRVYERRVYGGGTGARAAQVHGRTRARAHRRTGGTYTAVGIQARE